MSFSEGSVKAFLNGSVARALGVRLILTAGVLELAGATDVEIGVADEIIAADVYGSVRLCNAQGTRIMLTTGSVTSGASVYGAANGLVSASQGAGAFFRGTALEGRATGEEIEVLPADGFGAAGT